MQAEVSPADVDLYGGDHSPWVQAVLLGLHDRGVAHSLTTVPPLSVFRKSGVTMPVASIDGRPWQLESAELLQQVGFEPISRDDLRAIYGAWQGVLHRADHPLQFFHAWSLGCDDSASLARRLRNHFLRSFVVLYFCVVIRFAVLTGRRIDPENFGDQFLYWEQRLNQSAAVFLGGDEPDMSDLMLFGIVQCHCSIPVPPIQALQTDPRLGRVREWIGAMHQRFSGYGHLYSGVYFEPNAPAPPQTTLLEKTVFWLGVAVMAVSFLITVPLIAYLASRVRRTQSRG